MVDNVVKLRDAFGVGREIPLNYVARPDVDQKFIDSLTRDKHVVIYGSSNKVKQLCGDIVWRRVTISS